MSQQLKKRPVIEIVDIRKTAQTIRLNQPFTKVSRLITFYEWEATTVDYHLFAGDAILTNGIQILVDKRELLPETIKANRDHLKYAYDVAFKVDSVGVTKHAYLTSRLSFHKFMGNEEGVDLTSYDLDVVIQDDLSSVGTELKWIFEGWTWDK